MHGWGNSPQYTRERSWVRRFPWTWRKSWNLRYWALVLISFCAYAGSLKHLKSNSLIESQFLLTFLQSFCSSLLNCDGFCRSQKVRYRLGGCRELVDPNGRSCPSLPPARCRCLLEEQALGEAEGWVTWLNGERGACLMKGISWHLVLKKQAGLWTDFHFSLN